MDTTTAIGEKHPDRDVYEWVALYDDGTHLMEHADDGPHRFAEIDHERLTEFQLHPQRHGLPLHVIHLEDDWRLIFFRRVSKDANGPLAGIPRKLHVIGRQQTMRGANVKHLMAITESGDTFTTSDDDLIVA